MVAQKERAPYVAVLRSKPRRGSGGARESAALFEALSPEAGRGLAGAEVKLRRLAGGSVEVRIEATSLRALRASVNSYLRWSTLAVEVARSAGEGGEEE